MKVAESGFVRGLKEINIENKAAFLRVKISVG